jgi:drug/metabolite transporter (DMT)-like permease
MSTVASAERTDLGYALALAAALVLSFTGILIRHLSITFGLPPLVLAFWRNAFVVATLLVSLGLLAPGRLSAPRRHLPFLACYGLVLAAFNGLWTFSVARVGASLATVLVYTSGAATALLGAALLDERLGRAKLAAVAACTAGCVLVVRPPPGAVGADLAGLAAGLLSGLAYAVYSLMGRAAAQRGLDAWSTVLHTFGFGALALLAGLGLASAAAPHHWAGSLDQLLMLGSEPAGWGELLLLAAGPTVIGFGLYGASLAHLPASVANLILTLEPALTAALAWAWLGERLSGVQVAGSALIVAGVVALRLGERVRGTSVSAALTTSP